MEVPEPTTVEVNVTAEDLKSGWDWSCLRLRTKYGQKSPAFEDRRSERCPVALALCRTFGVKCLAETYRLTVGKVQYRTPEVVSDWMSEFDFGRPVEPFTFTVDTVDELTPRVEK